jgi:hypothetical protein
MENLQQQQPTPQPERRVRFVVRVEAPTGIVRHGKHVYRIEEVGAGLQKDEQIAFAMRHHDRHNLRTWVLDIRTGDTVYQLEPKQIAAAGGGAA